MAASHQIPQTGGWSGLRTYLVSILFLLPALLAWLFVTVFELPRLQMVWQGSRLTGSHAQWLMDTSNFCIENGRLLLALLVLIFAGLEYFLPSWPRYRAFIILLATLVLNACLVAGLVAVSSLALVAGSVLVK